MIALVVTGLDSCGETGQEMIVFSLPVICRPVHDTMGWERTMVRLCGCILMAYCTARIFLSVLPTMAPRMQKLGEVMVPHYRMAQLTMSASTIERCLRMR
jgi:hypothetical protein